MHILSCINMNSVRLNFVFITSIWGLTIPFCHCSAPDCRRIMFRWLITFLYADSSPLTITYSRRIFEHARWEDHSSRILLNLWINVLCLRSHLTAPKPLYSVPQRSSAESTSKGKVAFEGVVDFEREERKKSIVLRSSQRCWLILIKGKKNDWS